MAPEACKPIKDDFIACVLRSNCVLKSGKSPEDCIKNSSEELPSQCQHLKISYYDCKRGMLDMRKRFRGNHLSANKKASADPVSDVVSL